MCLEQESCVDRQSFTLQVQDSEGQSDLDHFEEESRDYLPSNSRENQLCDSESTDDGFDHQVHLSTSHQWLCLSCMTSGYFFSPIDWNNSVVKLLIIVHFFALRNKHLATFTQNLKEIKTRFFFFNLFCGSTRFFFLQHWKWLGPERLMPL